MEVELITGPSDHRTSIIKQPPALANVAGPLASNGDYLQREFARVERRAAALGEGALEDWRPSRRALIAARHDLALARGEQSVPLEALSRQLDLRPEEEEALIILAAMHLAPRAREALLRAAGRGAPYLTCDLLSRLLASPDAPLSGRRWCDPRATLSCQGLARFAPRGEALASERLGHAAWTPHFVAALLEGQRAVDLPLREHAALWTPPPSDATALAAAAARALDDDGRQRLSRLVDSLRGLGAWHASAGACCWNVLLSGAVGVGKTQLVGAVAAAGDASVLTLRCDELVDAPDPGALLTQAADNARLVGRFTPLLWHLDRADVLLDARPRTRRLLQRLLNTHVGLVALEVVEAAPLEAALPRTPLHWWFDLSGWGL